MDHSICSMDHLQIKQIWREINTVVILFFTCGSVDPNVSVNK